MISAKTRPSALLQCAFDAMEQSRDGLISHNVRIGDRRTSFRLDALTWDALGEIARRERITVRDLCTTIARAKPRALSLTVAIRCCVLGYFRHRRIKAYNHRTRARPRP